MTKFEKDINIADDLIIKLDGDFILNLTSSDSPTDRLEIYFNGKEEDIKTETSETTISITHLTKYKPDNESFGRFKESVQNNKGVAKSIFSFIEDLMDVKNNVENSKMEINVNINLSRMKNERILTIDASNIDCSISDIKLKELIINSANTSFESKNLSSGKISIDSSNIKGIIEFNEKNRNILIRSSNCRLKVLKPSNFNGNLTYLGNNIKSNVDSDFGDKKIGEITVEANNGKLFIEEI